MLNERVSTSGQSGGCSCSSGDEAFLASLDDAGRAVILDPSTAPVLPSSAAEVFSLGETGEMPVWTKALWNLHKEVIDATIAGGWDNRKHPWNREMQDFWKYPIAFTSYGFPSLVMDMPQMADEVIDVFRKHILLIKDAGAFDEWTRLEFGKDPVSDKNIMYKGHLNLMYGLYRLMSGSTEFDEEYRILNKMIVTETANNGKNRGFWGIECEPDQYFPPCNAVGIMSEKVYDLNFGTHYAEEVGARVAEFIHDRMLDPVTGITMYRYHPSCDFVEPYIVGDMWATTMLDYYSPEQCQGAYRGVKREFLADIKGGKECYLKANRFAPGASTDYEQSTLVLYVPFATREFDDPETWEKVNRYFIDMYDIQVVDGTARFLDADPTIESHAEGYLLLGCIHANWKRVVEFDWSAFREQREG